MRWMALNTIGCLLWVAGLVYAKGVSSIAGSWPADGNQLPIGLAFGLTGLVLLMWVNLLDAS